jgi:serine/threonine protein kinase
LNRISNGIIGMDLLDGRYTVLNKLGAGGYGNVFLVKERYGAT